MNFRTLFLVSVLLVSCNAPATKPVRAQSQLHGIWITGYLEAWNLAPPKGMPISAIDFNSITAVAFFALTPTADGGIDMSHTGMTDDTANQVSAAAHAANCKAMICVGGAGSGAAYEAAISDLNRDKFVAAIVGWTVAHHYDGVDVDMEPVPDADIPNFKAFVKGLRLALRAKNPDSLLTAAANGNELNPYVATQGQFDQINVMTYDYSGTWEGWETWFNSPLFNNDGLTFMSNDKPLPCIQTTVQMWAAAGIDPAKTGIGAAFYCTIWKGASGPNQPIAGVKTETMNYNDMMAQLYTKERYHWDKGTNSPYLSIVAPDKKNCEFISYDNDKLCRAKVRFIRDNSLGGMIIWHLAGDYFPNATPDKQQPLLSAIQDEASKLGIVATRSKS